MAKLDLKTALQQSAKSDTSARRKLSLSDESVRLQSEHYSKPASRVNKKAITVYLAPKVAKTLKQIALDRETSIQALVEKEIEHSIKHRLF